MKRTLVFGASLKPDRYSYYAIERLVAQGIETHGFGIREGNVSGVPVRNSLEGLEDIHTVSLYLRPATQQQYYQDILALKPKRVIFNPGTENNEFARLLEANGIAAENSCTLVLLSTQQF
ncbi:CoA-binding protein [Lentiprolixibacter aurantiacus]|uniref:CoA-binding protein n=1 Tax=Lentiprolixibacter aurantiacus TaxID=2993939 RepID=A0AAE3MNK9_9FLAO|nr:CoA-binding protein [Lentiprolixibacter aurantiacus]